MRCLRRLLTTTLIVAYGLLGCGGGGGSSKPDPAVAPTITTQPASRSVSQGQPASFTVVASGTAPMNYQWRKDGVNLASANTATFSLAAAAASDAGTYTVVVSNSAGTVTSSAATLTVVVPPAITTQPVSTSVNQGQRASFIVSASGTAPLTYQWKKDGAGISGASASTFSIAAAQPGDAGSYTVVVSNSAGTVTSNAATLTVVVPPAITTQPVSTSVNQGQTASFIVSASGTAPLTYQWKKDGASISGASAATFSIAAAQPSDAGSYTVVVSNSAGTVTSIAATLTVVVPPAITTQPVGTAVNQGQTTSFSVSASGTAPLGYQWKKDGTNISGATAATLSIAAAQPSDAGSYTVVVSNSAGTVVSNSAILTVNLSPVIQAFTASPNIIPIGASGILSWSVSGATSLAIDNGVGTIPAPSGTRNVAPSSTVTYTLTATNAAGSKTATATLNVDTTPFVITSFTANPSIVSFGGASTLSWSYTGLPLNLTLDGATIAGLSAMVHPVRRQSYTLAGMNGAGNSSRSLSVAARGLDLLAGNTDGAGNRDGTGGAAGFYSPSGVAVDSAGNVYVADTDNHTIRKVTPSGVVTTLAGSPGVPGTADGTGGSARFYNPMGVATDSTGNVYVADGYYNTIRKVTPSGVVTTLAGRPGARGSADGTGGAARFYNPMGVAVDSAGNVYVADTGNHTIRKVTPSGVVTTLAGSPGVRGSADGTGGVAQFNTPSGVAVDSAGDVYVADIDNSTIRKVTPSGVVTTLAGSPGAPGSADGTGSAARFIWPNGVAMDSTGNVYVGDTYNYTIRKVTPSGVVTTLAGQLGLIGFVPGILPGNLAPPTGIAVTPDGDLIVTCNNGIVQVTAP